MSVAYNQRTLPLSLNSSNTISQNISLAYDFTGVGALAEGAPYSYTGATAPTLVKSGSIPSVTLNGIPGRQVGYGAQYVYQSASDFGFQFGTGDFTVAVFLSTGATLPTTSGSLQLLRIDNGGSTPLIEISVTENPSTGWYSAFTLSGGIGAGQTPIYYGTSKSVVFWIRRLGGQVTTWTQEVGSVTTPTLRNAAVTSSVVFDSTSAQRLWAGLNTAGHALDIVTNNITVWKRGLSDIEIRDASRDFWALNTNTGVADSIAITSPATGQVLPSTTTLSGTYVGTTPTGIEAQFGAGAWTALTGFAASNGTWSGSVALPVGGPSPLRVRETNNTATVSPDITNITVQNNSIAFTVPSTTTNGAVNYRLFQRDASNQAQVRITGSYTGTPTSIEYAWNGGAWASLVASPTGGTFDATVTLQGPGQGALTVRFSNDTSVSASLTAVGVGDIYLAAGQSNHQGQAAFTPAIAPSTHPQWKAIEFSKQHVWRENTESTGNVFDDGTSSVYAAYSTGGPASGSYFGALATVAMASGVPIAVIPCAKGSTNLDNWTTANPSGGTLYGALLLTAQKIGEHKAVLWWQGEAEANGAGDATQWATKMSTIMSDWATAGQTSKWLLINPCIVAMGGASASVVRAQIASMSSNANVIGVIDLDYPSPAYAALHYATTVECNTIANRIGAALGYAPPEVSLSPSFVFPTAYSASVIADAIVASTNMWDEVIEGPFTARDLMKAMAAVLLAKNSGMDTNTPVFRNLTDDANRVTSTTDANGNRLTVTINRG